MLLALAANLAFQFVIRQAEHGVQEAFTVRDRSLDFVSQLVHESDLLAQLVQRHITTGSTGELTTYHDNPGSA